MDPLQSYENFRTPFRETQMATIALSSYFRQAGRPKGWGSTAVDRIANDPVRLLDAVGRLVGCAFHSSSS